MSKDQTDRVARALAPYLAFPLEQAWEAAEVAIAAQRIEARSDETPKAVQPEGREPGPKDAPKLQNLQRGASNGQE